MPSTADSHWTSGPDRPLLSEGAVHVWRADLTAVADDLADLLCNEELARGGRLLSKRDRELWTRSRGVLRALLGRYLQRDPRALRFAPGEHGKPGLLEDAATERAAGLCSPRAQPARILFNLSHSRGIALYAFAPTANIGVDVEQAHRAIDAVAIAARVFGPAEAERLEQLDPVIRQREFLRAWVRHEAALKCLGVGLGGANVAVGEPMPWIVELDVGPGAAAAVAVQAPPQTLHCWDWPVWAGAEFGR